MDSWQIMLRDMSVLDDIFPSCITWNISLGLLMKYDLKLHGQAELSQYEILDLFVTQYISGSRNINIELYKGDITYVLCLI